MKKLLPYLMILAAAALTVYLIQSLRQGQVAPPPAEPQTVLQGRFVLTHNAEPAPDPLIEAALRDALRERNALNGETPPHFFHNRGDLDGDAVPEIFAYASGDGLCQELGCTLFVFRQEEDGYALLTTFAPVDPPFVVLDQQTDGWGDLLFRIPGKTPDEDYNAVLRYGADGYPDDPTVDNLEIWNQPISGTGYLNPSGIPPQGFPLTSSG